MGLFNKWKKKVEVEPYRISAPVAGKVIDIKDTNDQVFNSEVLKASKYEASHKIRFLRVVKDDDVDRMQV